MISLAESHDSWYNESSQGREKKRTPQYKVGRKEGERG